MLLTSARHPSLRDCSFQSSNQALIEQSDAQTVDIVNQAIYKRDG